MWLLSQPSPWRPTPSITTRSAGTWPKAMGYTNQAGEPTAFRPPVYPLFLAGIFYTAGHDLEWVRWVQALLGAGICVLVCLTARQAL
ncbi:MAG: hypothetical protein MZV70_20105 [Desulfobacterales bacterium]|nr:hypothetical protein [Desulfobacterales bacterium]